jgi:microcompartment protein CcmL/EutN
VKAAHVDLIGYELTRGGGMVVIKVEGDVGAVKAAVEAGAAAVSGTGRVYATHVIPRPSPGLDKMIASQDTKGKECSEQPIAGASGEGAEKAAGRDMIVEERAEPLQTEIINGNPEVTCNLCGDPACTRKKGDPKVTCIHYNDHNKEEE